MRLRLPEPYELQIHATAVSCLDYDGSYIFSGCEDGSVALIKYEEQLTEERLRVMAVSNDLYLEEIFKI